MIRILFLLLIALNLISCSTALKKNKKKFNCDTWFFYQKKLNNLHYQVNSTLFYSSNRAKFYVRMFWQKTDQNYYQLILSNILGNIILKINLQPGKIQLIDNKGKNYFAKNAEEMITQLTGIAIPINNLNQWLLGLPGGAKNYVLDHQCRLSRINYTRNGKIWKIVYSNYKKKNYFFLPLDIELTESDKYIKIKIKNWIIK